MKKKVLSFYYITLMLISQVFAVFTGVSTPVNAVNVNNFYFDDFTGDYYLSRDADGISHLKVKESVTAVFPDYNQNKGICRQIAYTNQGGANVTLANLTRANLTLTRNGVSEPIYSIEKEDGYYNVCTGTEEYVLGRQTYVFEYQFDRVVTDFESYQELYWDTNGNGASQRFNKVTARVHFVGDTAKDYTGKTWCYVGKYGANGQERCTITKLDDGVQYEAEDLAARENLTFDIELKPGSFVVPEPQKNYTLVIIMVITLLILCGLLIWPIRKFMKVADKRKFYKGFFVKPEYQPNPNYAVADMVENYIGSKKEVKVSILLDLIVQKKVTLIDEGKKGLKKHNYKLIVKNLEGVGTPERDVLAILNGGMSVSVGDEVEIKRRPATSTLESLGRTFQSQLDGRLEVGGLYEKGKAKKRTSSVIAVAIVFIMVAFSMGFLENTLDMVTDLSHGVGMTGLVVGQEVFLPAMALMIIIYIVIFAILKSQTTKYAIRTKLGLEMSRYMDGMKLYIEMAEADRLKFLQSINGADVSTEGIVYLYEKMLPYAAALGLEDSWMKELEKYYQMTEVVEPDWYRSGITVRDMYAMSTMASGYVRSSTTMSSSGGSSSSGSSGGGGGGFSGGGGGGGGFSGR